MIQRHTGSLGFGIDSEHLAERTLCRAENSGWLTAEQLLAFKLTIFPGHNVWSWSLFGLAQRFGFQVQKQAYQYAGIAAEKVWQSVSQAGVCLPSLSR